MHSPAARPDHTPRAARARARARAPRVRGASWHRLGGALLATVATMASCTSGASSGVGAAPQDAPSTAPAVASEDGAATDVTATGSEAAGATRLAAPVPTPRTEVAGAAWRGGVVVLGGLEADRPASSLVHSWDPSRDEWARWPDLPRPLHHTAAVVRDDTLWVIGGFEEADGWRPTGAVWVLTDPAGSWLAGPALPSARGALAAAALDDGRIVVTGGVGPEGASATSWILEGDEWVEGPPLPEAVEHHTSAVTADGHVLVIGGRVDGIGNSRTTTTSLDLDRGTAEPGPELSVRRSGIGAAGVAGLVCVAGGEVPEGTVAAIECLDPDVGVWTTVAELSEPRHGLAVVALDGRLHVVAGGPQPGETYASTHEVVTP